MGGNASAFEPLAEIYRADARKDAAARVAIDQAAAEAGLWELADLYMPNDICEAAERWRLEHTIPELWRGAFIQGWRAAMRSRHDAKK
jgi:hypothetical protein